MADEYTPARVQTIQLEESAAWDELLGKCPYLTECGRDTL